METNEDEWELVNDQGFVYKRKKRLFSPTTTTSSSADPPPTDPAIEASLRQKRKKKALISLKNNYQKELSQWELLSNTLNAMQAKAKNLEEARLNHARQEASENPTSDFVSNGVGEDVLDQLLVQVEAQEAIIQDVSNLCDLAEALCDAEEEKFKQSFIELPIWDCSPQELMASLCED